MSRKPIQIETRGLMTPRERVWAAIQKTPDDFTKATAQDNCKPMVHLRVAEKYIDCLEKSGHIERAWQEEPDSAAAKGTVHFRLVKRQYHAPRLTDQGELVNAGWTRQALWTSMKVLKRFDYLDLAAAASLNDFVVMPDAAKKYVLRLAAAGYLAVVKPGKSGPSGTPTVYRLQRNSGPHAPAITRRLVVFDRNTGDSFNLETPQEVCDALE